MNSGFGNNIQVNLNKTEINKLIKDYKKIKRYMRSPIYHLKTMDGTETVVKELLSDD